MIVYFSGTGNSRFAAEFLSKQLNDEVLDAGKRMKTEGKDTLTSERPWIFVSPVYAWRMAAVFADYLRRTELKGNKNAYFVLTCGGDIGNAGKYAAQLCAEIGLQYRGVLELVMPENYIAMFNAPGAEEAKQIVAAAKPVLEGAGQCVLNDTDFPKHKTNLFDNLKSGPINEGFYRFYVKSDAFYATDRCIGCGECVNACPLNNICLEDNKPIWGTQCTHCMACICGCPVEAIEYGKRSIGKPRYQCPKDEDL
jgi:flavodoxin